MEPLPDWSHLSFHPVVLLPPGAPVRDLSGSAEAAEAAPTPWGAGWSLGRYDEDRGIYTAALFAGSRTVHMGLDIGGPVGTAAHAFWPGRVLHAGRNPAPGDYGHVIVTAHEVEGRALYVLLGHLSAATLAASPPGRAFGAGEVLGWLGDRHENGGWFPHVHVQLSWARPETHDLPGAVTRAERAAARARFPDPRLILGPLY